MDLEKQLRNLRPYRNSGNRKTEEERRATHKSKYGTKLPNRKYKNRR